MSNSTIRMELFSPRIDKTGKAPLRLIYQISGERKFIYTGIKLFPANWDSENQKGVYLDKKSAKSLIPLIDFYLLPSAKDVYEINRSIDTLCSEIRNIEKRFELDKIRFNAEMIIDKYKELHSPNTKRSQPKKIVSDYIDKYIEEQKTSKAPNSLKIYKALKYHLEDFAKHTKGKVVFTEMDKSFFAKFQNYLVDIKLMRNTTTAKQLSTLKTILNYADSCGIEVDYGYKKFKIKREELPVVALTEEEFLSLYNLDLSDYSRKEEYVRIKNQKKEWVTYETLDKARDILCFGAMTGMRYSDLSLVGWQHIIDGVIDITIVKTKRQLYIPLNNYALSIITKHKVENSPIPRLSNQRLNDYVKILAKLAGIDSTVEIVRYRGSERIAENYNKYDLISSHIGRKTFCTLSLEKGMSAEQVMAISGHSDYKSFKRYVNVTNEVKKKALLNAWNR